MKGGGDGLDWERGGCAHREATHLHSARVLMAGRLHSDLLEALVQLPLDLQHTAAHTDIHTAADTAADKVQKGARRSW